MDQTRVVGWILHADNKCEICWENPAVVMITYDGIDSLEVCAACTPPGVHDSVAEVFKRMS